MKETTSKTDHRPRAIWIRGVALLLGLFYLALTIVGFVKYPGGMGPDEGRSLWGFGFSAFLNIAHLPAGVLGILAAYQERTARTYGWMSFFAASGLTAYGIVTQLVAGAGNVANVQLGNIILYAITAAIGVVISVLPTRAEPQTAKGTS